MAATRKFARSLDSVAAVYAFAESQFDADGIGDGVRFPVHLALEELFTNMVKYNPGGGENILVELETGDGGVTVTMTDYDVEGFDVTRPRDVPVDAPLEARKPGGLGLHLVQRMVDSLEYEYRNRQSRIRFTKEADG